MAWWNSSYLSRKEILISSSGNNGSLIQTSVDVAQLVLNKTVRSDYEDIEIVHETADATPSYTVLGRDVTSTTVSFSSPVAFPASDKIYIYYNNDTLTNAPSRPAYTLDLYPIITLQDGQGVTYTRPGEHWIDGSSNTRNSVASFKFSGRNIEVVIEASPVGGLFSVTLDNVYQSQLDAYSASTIQKSIYTNTSLSSGEHTISITALGEHNPLSSDSIIKLISFNTAGDISSSLSAEETYITDWTSYFGTV